MNHVYLALINRIKEYTDNEVYNGQAKDGARFPYAVLNLGPVDSTEKDRDDYFLTVSCWDKSESPSHAKVVNLAEQVRSALLNYRHLDDNQLIIVSRPNIGNVPDPDTQIKRYDVSAIIKTYRR